MSAAPEREIIWLRREEITDAMIEAGAEYICNHFRQVNDKVTKSIAREIYEVMSAAASSQR